MRPCPGVLRRMRSYRLFSCLCLALCAASPSTANAQQAVTQDWNEKYGHSAAVQAYSCVDPSAALARRWAQDEPCKLPMIHLPRQRPAEVTELPGRQSYAPAPPGMEGGHVMFWRFPVQGYPAHGAPRHTWR